MAIIGGALGDGGREGTDRQERCGAPWGADGLNGRGGDGPFAGVPRCSAAAAVGSRVDGGSGRMGPTVWFSGAVAICLLLLAATFVASLGGVAGPAEFLLSKFDLAQEANPAAWWSGMLLAVASLHAYDGYVLRRQHQPVAARGWALVAALLLILSADEVASVHERVGQFGASLGIGMWPSLLPFAAVLGAVLGYALVCFWSAGSGQQHRVFWSILIGFLLLGSAAPQEFIEHRVAWSPGWPMALRTVVEEGTELLGMVVLLRAAMGNTAGLSGEGGARVRPSFDALSELRLPAVALGLLLTPVLALVTVAVTDSARGRLADWLAAVAFLAAGLAVCRRAFKGEAIGRPAWLLAGLCILASVAVVDLTATKLVHLGWVGINLRMLVLGTIALLISAMWVLTPQGAGPWRRAAAVALATMAAVSLLPRTATAIYVLSPLLALIVYFVHATRAEGERVGAAPPRPVASYGR